MSAKTPNNGEAAGGTGLPSSALPNDDDEDLIVERLGWTPMERLQYLLDMLEFEERAQRARQMPEE